MQTGKCGDYISLSKICFNRISLLLCEHPFLSELQTAIWQGTKKSEKKINSQLECKPKKEKQRKKKKRVCLLVPCIIHFLYLIFYLIISLGIGRNVNREFCFAQSRWIHSCAVYNGIFLTGLHRAI